nr:MAG TPA_asm: hypothetical protein [Caudoviricetes sp.]
MSQNLNFQFVLYFQHFLFYLLQNKPLLQLFQLHNVFALGHHPNFLFGFFLLLQLVVLY